MDDCPIDQNIPIFLIVMGGVQLLQCVMVLLSVYWSVHFQIIIFHVHGRGATCKIVARVWIAECINRHECNNSACRTPYHEINILSY